MWTAATIPGSVRGRAMTEIPKHSSRGWPSEVARDRSLDGAPSGAIFPRNERSRFSSSILLYDKQDMCYGDFLSSSGSPVLAGYIANAIIRMAATQKERSIPRTSRLL
jgi:hypothetical protein